MSFYYGKVRDDELVCERCLQFKALLGDSGGDQLCLGRIFTTGIPHEEAGRYYSEKLLKTLMIKKKTGFL